ncbi:hypothetical protein FISHEDRAFT_70563 [Fistulina hepatica ATCC 64428]|uniref:Uncharacterized protein n=1 Tax=Fistulina hepatica ATCC 64428 TaxID=1128425 RepID=A0A0D7AIK4_9AGAR|nr:hypothetical protein FISHEDRAFT_70563 [Fistulina hepatica ATCC 64428]
MAYYNANPQPVVYAASQPGAIMQSPSYYPTAGYVGSPYPATPATAYAYTSPYSYSSSDRSHHHRDHRRSRRHRDRDRNRDRDYHDDHGYRRSRSRRHKRSSHNGHALTSSSHHHEYSPPTYHYGVSARPTFFDRLKDFFGFKGDRSYVKHRSDRRSYGLFGRMRRERLIDVTTGQQVDRKGRPVYTV